MKIAICIPVHGDTKAPFTLSLAEMLIHSAGLAELKVFIRRGSIDSNRREMARQAKEWGAESILWLDMDHVFPPDTLERLLRHDKHLIGCNQPKRSHEPTPTARITNFGPVFTTPEKASAGEIEEVHLLGFGVFLMRTNVLDALELPWFKSEVLDGGITVGEDYCFCIRARAAGFGVFVDHGLSWEVGHLFERPLWNSDTLT